MRFMVDAGLCNADGFVTRKHQGTTPLSVAIRNGRHATVRYLLQKGANVNFHDDQWLSPLHVAAGVSPAAHCERKETKCETTFGNIIIEDDDVSIVKLLVETKAALRARDHTRWTPLHYAVCLRRLCLLNPILTSCSVGCGPGTELTLRE